MKHLLKIALLLTGLAASAQAALTSGLEAGYLTDSEEAYYAVRFGGELKATTAFSHQLEAEVGFYEENDSGFTFRLTPLTLNYRAETIGDNKLGYYFGFGAGVVRAKVLSWASDNAFAAQGFAGVKYKASPNTALTLGVKYLWFGDATIGGTTARIGDDLALMGGVSIKF